MECWFSAEGITADLTSPHSILLVTFLFNKKFEDFQKQTVNLLDGMARLSKEDTERVREEEGRSQEEVEVMNVGKIDPKRHLESNVNELLASSIIQCLGTMLDTVVF